MVSYGEMVDRSLRNGTQDHEFINASKSALVEQAKRQMNGLIDALFAYIR